MDIKYLNYNESFIDCCQANDLVAGNTYVDGSGTVYYVITNCASTNQFINISNGTMLDYWVKLKVKKFDAVLTEVEDE